MNQLVTIVTPAYNAEVYIAQTIESVITQTYPHWEMIIVNDGSTDNTANIISQFKDPRLRYIYQENRGLGEARNTGICVARGEILAFLDADDLWDSKFLEKMVGLLNHHPEAVAGYCGFQYINSQGRPVGNPSLQVAPPKIFHKTLIHEGNWLVPCAVVLRKWSVEEIGLFDGSLWGVEDTDMWIRLSACHTFVGLSEILVRYRIHDRNMSRDPEHMMTGSHRLVEKRHGPPTGDVLSWPETKRLAYADLYCYGTWSYLAAGNISQSAAYFQQFFEIAPNMALGMAVWRMLARVHLPVEYRNDPTAPLNWEAAQRDIENLLDELDRRVVHLGKQMPRIKGSAFLALADEAARAGELKRANSWLWHIAISYPRLLFSRPYWGTLIRSIIYAKTGIISNGLY
ncbi:MAG: glycosyltransferase [Anaerolineae bacterium]|nr:glycosyltransferase [Anaerolineae bacterium]